MFYLLIFFNFFIYTADINSVFGKQETKTEEQGTKHKSINLFGKTNKSKSDLESSNKSGSGVFSRKENLETNKNVFSSDEEKSSIKTTFSSDFIWPIRDDFKLSSKYGWRSNKKFHDGIDLTAKAGAKIIAARSGKVIYSDSRINGYGNMIILSHPDKMYTVYAHNERNLVRNGDLVKQGEDIAVIGSTGRSTGVHLHFEIRKGKHSVNPLKYLEK